MSASTGTSVSVAVARAISYLTRPLIVSYPATTIIKLQLVLEANLTALYAPTWSPREPLSGSGRRCLTLSPECLPPRVIYAACLASGVQWFDWMRLLGNVEFDFFVDPGCVSVRVGKKGSAGGSKMTTVWADELPSPSPVTFHSQAGFHGRSKSLAQQLIEHDCEEDERIFSMIADEVSAPKWMTPVMDKFPISHRRSTSPLSSISSDSRCSSRSSNSSDCFSVSTGSSSPSEKQSRRERAKGAKVFVDTSKTEVTPYDGGKTTVLTGGVMLGGSKKVAKVAPSSHWRALRV